MEGEADFPSPRPAASDSFVRQFNPDSYLNHSITSSSSSSSSPGFIRHVQAAFKRHRPLAGPMQPNSINPRRTILPQRGTLIISAAHMGVTGEAKKFGANVSMNHSYPTKDLIALGNSTAFVVGETQEDVPITQPSTLGTVTDAYDERFHQCDVQRDQGKPFTCLVNDNAGCFSLVVSQQVPMIDSQMKVQFSLENNAGSQEMEWGMSNQAEASTTNNQDPKHQNLKHLESVITVRSDGGFSSLLKNRTAVVQDQLHQLGNVLSDPITQSLVAGSSCTSTLVNSTSAPMFNSTTYCLRPHAAVESLGDFSVNAQPLIQGDRVQSAYPSSKYTTGISTGHTANEVASSSAVDSQMEVKKHHLNNEQQGDVPKESVKDPLLDNTNRGKALLADVTDVQSQAPLSKNSTLDLKLDPAKSGKQEKAVSGKGASVSRKKNYDPDLFFKVNGKLYQRLGKIGSGGSSEVHKVITSDCTIYALKKITLKGRDYASAYGFCQEILYLHKLKGKNNIIQLIDYEVTDKNLLQEVMNSCMSNKDAKVKDDGYIYMVLEYGEIDLAHMLSQRWKEMDSCDQTIDENGLRFYWQQILQAVNTIHEERIVHSDLKPANFLLVKGSLKLIDFGIAKAIMSDTTNIQRDSQVGTLSYMSPEAFMCNESDANGNIIKCGRPSDIWSLGCILYQMVYGRTPFSNYKTFWAKFKVVTDPNHEITYEPVSNPWLLDLMKKCLAWDRNERWRIPELLQHPFLVPPVPSKFSFQDQNCKLLQLIADACANDREVSELCWQFQQLLRDPVSLATSELLSSRDQRYKLVSQMSELCFQLQQHLASPGQE